VGKKDWEDEGIVKKWDSSSVRKFENNKHIQYDRRKKGNEKMLMISEATKSACRQA
jgi:hypothetical protein